jgi:ABC-type Fe3+-hydroxamate transport system substrate-binding protein
LDRDRLECDTVELRGVGTVTALLLMAGVATMVWRHSVRGTTEVEAEAVGGPEGVPTRVAVIDPGINEVMVVLNLTDRMVGRPAYTDEEASTAHLPVLGTGISPSYEQIVRQGPDLILTTHSSRGTVRDNLQKIAPTELLPWLTADEVVQSIRDLGEVLGEPGPAIMLADELAEGLAPSTAPDAPRVLILLGAPTDSNAELWVVKPSSLHGTALLAAGGQHALSEEISGPPTLSIEGLIEVDPDIILVMLSGAGTGPDLQSKYRAFWQRFQMLSAVQTGKIGFLEGKSFFSTGPGILDFKHAVQAEITRLQGVP